MSGNEYVAQLEWQAENQQRIIRGLEAENSNLRNELCAKCGRYRTAHEGTCDDCKWRRTND